MRPRLALTTSTDRIEAAREPVVAEGLEPIALPCIEVSPVDGAVLQSARASAGVCDWLVVTSSRTIDFLWADGAMPSVPTAVVGKATAAAVESASGNVRLVGYGGADDLFQRLAGLVEGRFVYFPHGGSADLGPLRHIRDLTKRLETTAVYRTKSVAPADEAVDAVIFGSPSAVSGWFQRRDVAGLVVGAIGSTTADALAERGVGGVIVPERPSFRRLVSLITRHLAQRSVI